MRRFFLVLLPFLIVGPPAGYVTAFLTPTLPIKVSGAARHSEMVVSGDTIFQVLKMLGTLLAFSPFSYLVGGLSALIVGGACGFWHRQFGRVPWAVPVIVAVLISAAIVASQLLSIYQHYTRTGISPSSHRWEIFANISLMWFCAHISAAVAGWFFLKSRFWTGVAGFNATLQGAGGRADSAAEKA